MMNCFSHNEIQRMSEGGLVSPSAAVRQLIIGRPWVEMEGESVVQKCRVFLGNIEREISFRVHKIYADYLCPDWGDAYLIGLLNLAMRERCDIRSEAVLTGELVHQLKTELIPALVKYAPRLYAPSITADMADEPPPSAGKTGTGCSCGIDSLYAIKCLSESDIPSIHLDYLAINNVGAYTNGGKSDGRRYADNVANARAFAARYGYKIIVTDSNFSEAFPQNHYKTHLYSSCFAIHMLGGLWGRYYYASSGYDNMQDGFKLTNNESDAAGRYDLIALPAFSTSRLRICNQGPPASRFEKTKSLADYEPAKHYLNVCLRQGAGNCGYCPKCMRTLWALDALDKLSGFHDVFDVGNYQENHDYYMRLLYRSYLNGFDHHLNDESWRILKRRACLLSMCYERVFSWLRFGAIGAPLRWAYRLVRRHLIAPR